MVNVAPRGRNVGYFAKKKETGLSELTKAAVERARIASSMEDSTEKTIGSIESLRQETLSKVER